jgi:hypothetical protein
LSRESAELFGQHLDSASAAAGEPSNPFRRRPNNDAAAILGVGLALHKAVVFEAVDEPGHRGWPDALCGRELADRDRTRVHDDRERRESGRGDAERLVLGAKAA